MNHAQLSDASGASIPSGSLLYSRIRNLLLRDTNIVVISVVLNNFMRAVSSVLLTRLLVPEVFGITGIISSIAFTVGMMSDLGFQSFVIRHPDGDKPRFLDTIWTMQVVRSIVVTVALLAAAPAIAALLGKHDLEIVIIISTLSFLIDGVASITMLTALRHRMILRLSLLELAVLTLQVLLSVVFAYFWRSYWAILTAGLIASSFKTLLSYVLFPNSVRRPALDHGYVRDLWGFARFVTGSSIITLLLLQGDKLVLARLMPLDQFGIYMLAVNLAGAPLAFAWGYASRVLSPYYGQAWREGRPDLRGLYYAKRRLPSLLYSFAAGGLIGSAPLIIAILYDPRYSAAATYLQLLSISSLLALPSNSANESLTATGHVSAMFQSNLTKFIGIIVTGSIGFTVWGMLGLVTALGLIEVPPLIFKWFRLRQVGLLDLRRELQFLAASIPGLAIGAAGDWLLRPYFA
ncbi:MAG: oligosaccharide flippase family protein [Novosphingobium sp.]